MTWSERDGGGGCVRRLRPWPRIGGAFLLMLAGAAVPAAAAVSPDFNPEEMEERARRAIFETQSLSVCLATWPYAVQDPTSEERFDDCRCALARYAAGRDAAELEPLGVGNVERLLGPLHARCRAARLAGTKLPPVLAAPPIGAKPIDETSAPADEAETNPEPAEPAGSAEDKPEAGSAFDPLAQIALPSLSGAWLAAIPIAIVLLIVILVALRRRRRRDDLIAPPAWMRADDAARPGPPPSPPADPNWPQ